MNFYFCRPQRYLQNNRFFKNLFAVRIILIVMDQLMNALKKKIVQTLDIVFYSFFVIIEKHNIFASHFIKTETGNSI